eukprot:3224759-Rhodomonas_salina.1
MTQQYFAAWTEAVRVQRSRQLLLGRRFLKIMMSTTRVYLTEWRENVQHQKSRELLLVRLGSRDEMVTVRRH